MDRNYNRGTVVPRKLEEQATGTNYIAEGWQRPSVGGYGFGTDIEVQLHGNPFGPPSRRWGVSVVASIVDVRTDGDGEAEMILARWRTAEGELLEVWRPPSQTRPVITLVEPTDATDPSG
jgi:hypothetical protein